MAAQRGVQRGQHSAARRRCCCTLHQQGACDTAQHRLLLLKRCSCGWGDQAENHRGDLIGRSTATQPCLENELGTGLPELCEVYLALMEGVEAERRPESDVYMSCYLTRIAGLDCSDRWGQTESFECQNLCVSKQY